MARRLLAAGSAGAGAWRLLWEEEGGDKKGDDGVGIGVDREQINLLLSTIFSTTAVPLPPIFHSWKLALHQVNMAWHSFAVYVVTWS